MFLTPRTLPLLLALLVVPPFGQAADWPSWRGMNADGVSPESQLPAAWTPDGENMLWRAPIGGRATPIVMNGRVCVIALAEPAIEVHRVESVVCLDEDTGRVLWDHRYPIYQTDIPHHRIGWASLVGDPETDTIYAFSVNGLMSAFRGVDGMVLWRRSLEEEVGRISGFGGRTVTPVVDGDLVITSFLSAGWGDTRIPRHRFYALDKHTGETVWVATPGGAPLDTTYSVPVVGEVDGQRLLFDGNADGFIYALQVSTGKKVWGFPLSKRGINASVVERDGVVYAGHSEDNVNGSTAMGRVVALDSKQIDAEGQPKLLWGVEGFTAGYASPSIANGILYHIDNSANLAAFDVKTGEELWRYGLGIAQRGSPVVGGGKIYVMDVDGKFHILQDNGRDEPEPLDLEEFKSPDGSAAQTNGSPAVANGRVYFMTVHDTFAIGPAEKVAGPAVTPITPPPSKAPAGAKVAQVQIVPAEINLYPGVKHSFRVRTFDAKGNLISAAASAAWKVEGFQGSMAGPELTVGGDNVPQAGKVTAEVDGVAGSARVQIRPNAPYTEDFSGVAVDAVPNWTGAFGRFKVVDMEGEKVLFKPSNNPRTWKTTVYTGDPGATNYVVQVDAMAKMQRRRMPDFGLISHRYTLDFMGMRRELRVRSWHSELGFFSKAVKVTMEPDVWYRMKFDVSPRADGTQTVLRGKLWNRDEPEPEEWTIEAVHNEPNLSGSPGLYGYSPADAYYDNYAVTPKPPEDRGLVRPAQVADLPLGPQAPQTGVTQ